MISLTHVLLDPSTPPEDAVVRAPIPDLPNLDVLPSSIMLFKTEFKLAAKGERIRLLSYYLQDNQDFFSRYDYIIIDTNPGLGLVNQNAFFAADSIVLMTDVSNNGLTGVEVFQFSGAMSCAKSSASRTSPRPSSSATTTSASSSLLSCWISSCRAKTWSPTSCAP